MTREEAKNKVSEYLDFAWCMKEPFISIEDAIIVVDDLFDDFESMTCENCYYSDTSVEGTIICRHDDDAMPFHVPMDFGCNKFERKE